MWYYAKHGQQIGPVSREELQGLLHSQQLAPVTRVWTEGMEVWKQANEVPELMGWGPPQPLPGAAYGPPLAAPTNSMAIASLVLGLLGLFVLGPFTSVPAIICGHVARRQIRDSSGQQAGDGMAQAGLIIGYLATALYACLLLVIIVLLVAEV